ncbi:MAG: cation:proton antiporter [Lachnospiraceae bacterium]|nr:cation:proton antiporter [Candidatus Equihabitans merdae]
MQNYEAVMALAIALFAGMMMTRVFKACHLHFPDVTAFLIAGILVGPYVLGQLGIPGLGFVSEEAVSSLSIISNAALGFIAFSIGSEFKLEKLKKTGKTVIRILLGEALCATILVDVSLLLLHMVLGEEVLPVSVCITLGAIAAATAPAATLMVIRQYKAKGQIVDLLLPVVALDDAAGIIIFAVSFGVAQALEGGNLSPITVVVNPLLEIVGSLVLGALLGFVMTKIERLFYSNRNRLAVTISFVFFAIAISSLEIPLGPATLSFSSLLVMMMVGMVFCNMSAFSQDIFNRADSWTQPLFACFFVLSGADLDLSVFSSGAVVAIGVVYVLMRVAGKYLGCSSMAKVSHCDKDVVRYMGITLFPQAGVALGLSLRAMSLGSGYGTLIRNVILFGVMIYELAGPAMTKWALTKAGEITEKPHEKTKLDRFDPKPQA